MHDRGPARLAARLRHRLRAVRDPHRHPLLAGDGRPGVLEGRRRVHGHLVRRRPDPRPHGLFPASQGRLRGRLDDDGAGLHADHRGDHAVRLAGGRVPLNANVPLGRTGASIDGHRPRARWGVAVAALFCAAVLAGSASGSSSGGPGSTNSSRRWMSASMPRRCCLLVRGRRRGAGSLPARTPIAASASPAGSRMTAPLW